MRRCEQVCFRPSGDSRLLRFNAPDGPGLPDAIRWRCGCQVWTLPRRRLVRLVGPGERLHLIGLRRELWCDRCGDVPMVGRVVSAP